MEGGGNGERKGRKERQPPHAALTGEIFWIGGLQKSLIPIGRNRLIFTVIGSRPIIISSCSNGNGDRKYSKIYGVNKNKQWEICVLEKSLLPCCRLDSARAVYIPSLCRTEDQKWQEKMASQISHCSIDHQLAGRPFVLTLLCLQAVFIFKKWKISTTS